MAIADALKMDTSAITTSVTTVEANCWEGDATRTCRVAVDLTVY